ncbi:hypothetical protein F5X99DRAFT_405521 [Biscogniauxia marginata]|nr:hypothetical protein F5X99DRAFT_405521 [Biscogniauxia marginata]
MQKAVSRPEESFGRESSAIRTEESRGVPPEEGAPAPFRDLALPTVNRTHPEGNIETEDERAGQSNGGGASAQAQRRRGERSERSDSRPEPRSTQREIEARSSGLRHKPAGTSYPRSKRGALFP